MKNILCGLVVVFFLVGCQSRSQKVEEKAKEASQTQTADAAVVLVAQGQQQLANNNIKDAATAFRSALEIDPRNVQSYLSLSEIFMRLGKFSDAQTILEQAVVNAPENGSIFYLLSVAHQQQGKIMPALLAARKSVELFQKAKDQENFKQSVALVQTLASQASQQQAAMAPAQPKISPQETATVIPSVDEEVKPVVERKQNFGPR